MRHTLTRKFGQYPVSISQFQEMAMTATSFRHYRCLPLFIFPRMYGCKKSVLLRPLNVFHSRVSSLDAVLNKYRSGKDRFVDRPGRLTAHIDDFMGLDVAMSDSNSPIAGTMSI